MDIKCSIALDALSIVYMLILIINLKHKHKWELLNFQYFRITVMICVLLALDIAYLSLCGSADLLDRALLKAIKSVYLIVNSAIVWLWVRYVDCVIFGDQYRVQKHGLFYTAAFAVNTALVAVNLGTDILFTISPGGHFAAGGVALWLFTVLNYLSMILAMVILVKNRRRVERKFFLPLLIFPLPPFCAELVQIFFRPFSFMCTYAVSALIVFQVSQNNTIYTDELTGLSNRRMLNETLQKWLSAPRGELVCGIMLDLDSLKQINDSFGHLSGDRALLALAEIIKSVRRKDIVSARYGGDEFVMLWRSRDAGDIARVEQKLLAASAQVNGARPVQERISFSMGVFCCRDDAGLSEGDFLRELDTEMYRSKNEKKQSE